MAYYPPYHSKYNPIERCWGILENHWNGSLLDSIGAVVGFAESMTYAGSVAKSYGQNIEDTATAIAVLGNAGIKGSVAGTSLAAFMNRLAAPEGKKAPALIKQLGIQVKDAHGAMRPLPDLINQVLTPRLRGAAH